MVRAGLYARVSTQDQQTLSMQSRAVPECAARRGWTVTMQIRGVGSGASRVFGTTGRKVRLGVSIFGIA
jgi:DNA invertase Pin-like site-specific DNA recombinase